MSVLIRGMEMPERCGVCPCFHANSPIYCQAVPAVMGKRIVSPYGLPRPDWCPLVELPSKHGRLVDADLAMEKLAANKKEAYTKHDVWLKFSTYGAPTVLEAEGEDDA